MPAGRQQKINNTRRNQQHSISEDTMSSEEDDVMLEEGEEEEAEDSSSYSGGASTRRPRRGTRGRSKSRGVPSASPRQYTKRAANRAAAHRCRDRKRAALENCERELVQCLQEHAQLQQEAAAMEQQLLQEVASVHALKTFMLMHAEHLGKRLPPEAAVQLQHLLHGMPGVSGYPAMPQPAKPSASGIRPHQSQGAQQRGVVTPGTALNASSMQPDAGPGCAVNKEGRPRSAQSKDRIHASAAAQPGLTSPSLQQAGSVAQVAMGAMQHGQASRQLLAKPLSNGMAATTASAQVSVPQQKSVLSAARVPPVAPRQQPLFTPFAAYPHALEETPEAYVVTAVSPSANLNGRC